MQAHLTLLLRLEKDRTWNRQDTTQPARAAPSRMASFLLLLHRIDTTGS